MNPLDRLMAKVEKAPDGCWLYVGGINRTTGYGNFWLDGRTALAHRASYELFRGPIPMGLQIDHICKVRHCVNPDHLEPVTAKVNMDRAGQPVASMQRAKTHCRRGHAYDAANTYLTSQGFRQCRTCSRENQRRYKQGRAA